MLLKNNAEKLVDPDLRRRYNLDLITRGDGVYNVTKRSKPDKNGKSKILEMKLMCRVQALSVYYKNKGNGLFDKDFLNDPKMKYHCCLDEFQKEKAQKNTFDIVYGLANTLENDYRSTKDRIKIFMIGNLLEDASDVLCAFNFIPETPGIYKLKKKRCVIQYIPNDALYKKRRKGTIADLLLPTASTFSNEIKTDTALIDKSRLQSPTAVIKFSKNQAD